MAFLWGGHRPASSTRFELTKNAYYPNVLLFAPCFSRFTARWPRCFVAWQCSTVRFILLHDARNSELLPFFWKFRFIFFKPRNAWHFFFACAGLTHEVLPTAAICRSHVSCSCLQVNDCLNSSSFKGCTVAGRLLRLGRLNSLVATGSLVGLSSQTKLQARSDWNMKHYISVEFLSNLNVKPPPCTNGKPPPLLTTSWRRFHDWSNEVVREDIFAHDAWFQILRISRFFHVTLLRALTSPSSASVTTSFVTSHCFSSSAHSMTCSLLQCNCYIFMRLLSYNLTLYLQFVVFITRLIFSVSPTTAHCDM